MFKILIVEDDRGIAEGIQSLLEQWGMEARQVQDFRNITGEFETYQPHLILLDIKLPTVKTHVSHILTKLNVSRRSEAKTAARRLWLVE